MNSTSTSLEGLIQRSASSTALGHRELLEGLRVHEVRVGAVRVEELHLARLGADRAELLARPERAVDHAPSDARRSFVRTNAPPLPGLTCWNSTILKTVPSTSMWLPFLNWLVLTTVT